MYCDTETVTLYSLNGCDSANVPTGVLNQLVELSNNATGRVR